jgi:vacuolar-type H+-ATPase subunit I/STV1
MDTIETLLAEYKSTVELQAFAKSQMEVIQNLTKKLAKVEEEKRHLEELLEQTNPLQVGQQLAVPSVDLGASDSEIIARTQLQMLRVMAMQGELTMEEVKKTEIFTNILLSLNKKEKEDSEAQITALDPKELLAALENTNE